MYIIFTKVNNRAGIGTQTDIKGWPCAVILCWTVRLGSSLDREDKKMKKNDASNANNGNSMLHNATVTSRY
jgi:hypothetical protein